MESISTNNSREPRSSYGPPSASKGNASLSWLFYPAPIAAFGALLFVFNNNFSMLIPAVIIGCIASLLRNNLLDLLKGLVIASVVATLVIYFEGTTAIATIIPTFAILMILFLVGGLFAWWFVNTLRKMANRRIIK